MVVASLAASHALGMGCSLVTSFDGVTGGAVDGGALAEGGSGGGDAASDASVDAAPTVDAAPDGRTKYTFVDSFERPNTAVGLANGWVAKTPSLRISDNRALRFNPGAGGDYRNNVTFRPSAASDAATSQPMYEPPTQTTSPSCASRSARIASALPNART